MKPWFRKSCDWHRTTAVDEIRCLLGQQAPLALVIFDSICAWCAEGNVRSIPAPSVDREVRTWTTNAPLGRRLVGALVEVGLLTQEGDGYGIAPAIIQSPEGAEGEQAPVSRRQRPAPETRSDRYRETHLEEVRAKDRKRKASRKSGATVVDSTTFHDAIPRRSTTDSTTPFHDVPRHSTTFRDSPAPAPSPPDPPPTHAPTPAQAQAQAHAGGAPAAAPVSHFSTTNEASSEPPPSATRPKAKPKKPSPKRTLPARAQLAAAYATGVSAATGAPCSPPSDRWDLDTLDAILTTHAPGLVGAEALGWLTKAAQDFADAKAEDRFTADKGFPPKMARAWLDGGNRPAPRDPGPRPPPPGPKVRPGPGPSHNWLLDDGSPPPSAPPSSGEFVADLTRDLFAVPAGLLAPEVPS